MTNQTNPSNPEHPRTRIIRQGDAAAVYGLGFIGALIYYIQHAATFGMGVLGVLKAVVWPVLVVYRLLDFLKM